jgi:5-formyltetrahydrofolate cyclo-ligase
VTEHPLLHTVPDADVVAAKHRLRARLIDHRRRRTATDREAARAANSKHVVEALAGVRAVAAYHPLPSEPLDPAMLDALASSGADVLVPIVTGATPLDWVRWVPGSELVRGPAGIFEPSGARLGARAVTAAAVMLLPALAIDRSGFRLGRGGGHYDRTLALVHSLHTWPELIAVINDDELLAEVPHDALDVPVTQVVTPRGGVRPV